ncbi:MAG TPA: excinuclease ABC subunit A, partial [Opitutae bacterium]|nr:excinuclease ABC subunit A [Opitutae bacterium]
AGKVKVEMNFLPTSYVPCEQCGGRRYRDEILELVWKGKNIADMLEFTFTEAAEFFSFDYYLKETFSLMVEAGLGYLRLGQISPTLSGGEAQRLKLASELARGIDKGKHGRGATAKPNLYILEEPTIGLHPSDTLKLISMLHRLVDEGNTVVVIEHDVDVISEADYLIELGPGGGAKGGSLIYQGSARKILDNGKSNTRAFLKGIAKEIDSKEGS